MRAAPEEEKKKKKKARWREQKGRTVVVGQIGFERSGEEVRAWLGAEVEAVRMVADAATRAKERQHAGVAYAVCADGEAAARVASRVEGAEFGGRRLTARLLGEESDESGRRAETSLLSATAVAALAERLDLALEADAIEALRSKPHSLVSSALRQTAKAAEAGKAREPSAYALGVVRRLERETRDDARLPRDDRAAARRLSPRDVDHLVATAVSRSNGGFKPTDVDRRARDFLRDFDATQAAHALSLVADCVSTNAKRRGRLLPKKRDLLHKVASPSAFLMGILRDIKRAGRDPPTRPRKHPSDPASAPPPKKRRRNGPSPPRRRVKPRPT